MGCAEVSERGLSLSVLDLAGICTRIDVYRHAGYFEPDQAEVLKARAADVDVRHPVTLLRNFVTAHAR